MTFIPSPWKMASTARLNFVSRSWIRNRGRWARSSSDLSLERHPSLLRSGRRAAPTATIRSAPPILDTSARLIPAPEREQRLSRLRRDLEDGSWNRRWGRLLELDELDIGCRVIVSRRT